MRKMSLIIPLILLISFVSACASPIECTSTSSLLYSNSPKLHQYPDYLYKPFINTTHQSPTIYAYETNNTNYNSQIAFYLTIALIVILVILIIIFLVG